MTREPGGPDEPAAERPRGRRETDLRDWRTGEARLLGVDIPPPRDGHLSAAVPPGVVVGAGVTVGAESVVLGRVDADPTVSDRILTPPNAISVLRILLIPVLVVCILRWDEPALALALLVVIGVSDWLDGKIARLWDMRSRLGEKLDPLADRILVVVVPIVLAIAGYVPWWVVGVLLARDALLVAALPVYRRRGLVPEVVYLGKAATFALFWAFPLLLASREGVPGEAGVRLVGEACLYWGVGLYVWSGCVYLWQARRVAASVPPSRRRV